MRSSEQLSEQILLEVGCGLDLGLMVESSIQKFLDVEVGVAGELEERIRVVLVGSVDEGVGCRPEGAQLPQDGRRLWEVQLL